MAKLPFSPLLLVVIPIDTRSFERPPLLQLSDHIFQIPTALRLGLRVNVNLRCVDLMFRNEAVR